MTGKETVGVKCSAEEPARDDPRFMVSHGGLGMVLVCRWCDTSLVRVSAEGDVDLADLMKVAADHDGNAIDAEGIERARQEARTMFGGLMPGNTGINLANEAADRLVAAYLGIGVSR